MLPDQPIIHQKIKLQRFPGKGGWTFAEVPGIIPDKRRPFGWVCVKGRIDDFAFSQVKLMPRGNGTLFFPVKASIRKKIRKEAGDTVTIVLFPDDSRPELPEELVECLATEPGALNAFLKLGDGAQKSYIDWIYSAKRDETRADRIVLTIKKLLEGVNRPSAINSGKSD
jgi:hypothetical protein